MLFEFIRKRFTTISGSLLIAVTVCQVFLLPVFPKSWLPLLTAVFFSLIILLGILSLERKTRLLFSIALLTVITELLVLPFDNQIVKLISFAFNVIFFQVMVVLFLTEIARSRKVNARTILEAINGYLMLGLMFISWVAILSLADPGAIRYTTDETNVADYTYFTFVTMTTLGYGDVLPVSPLARSLTILISTSGQLYIAIIIAMLVGKYSNRDTAD
ncbi:MAG: hypothetical protein Kow00127_12640 [Bacteroidales bacterium]